jgi:hypothetical protein
MRRFSWWAVALGCSVIGVLSAPPVRAAEGVPTAPFVGLREVRYQEFVAQMRQVADELANREVVQQEHAKLLAEYGLSAEQMPLLSFSRVRLAFEATRDGGLWGIRWAITDQMPWSDRIWKQWSTLALGLDAAGHEALPADAITAVAECDELSALFALLARDMGVEGFVGLHWPYWNHTVAVWQLQGAEERGVRILVPTSQVFLSREATLGTRELRTQRVVFPYPRKDLKPESALPGGLARALIARLRELGGLSSAELQARRNALGSS